MISQDPELKNNRDALSLIYTAPLLRDQMGEGKESKLLPMYGFTREKQVELKITVF